jgi:hypothetical protein
MTAGSIDHFRIWVKCRKEFFGRRCTAGTAVDAARFFACNEKLLSFQHIHAVGAGVRVPDVDDLGALCPKKGVWNFQALKTPAFIETGEFQTPFFGPCRCRDRLPSLCGTGAADISLNRSSQGRAAVAMALSACASMAVLRCVCDSIGRSYPVFQRYATILSRISGPCPLDQSAV